MHSKKRGKKDIIMITVRGNLRMVITMEKMILCLEIPAISKRFDVLINPEMSVGEITDLLGKAVEEASDQSYVSSGSEILCSIEGQKILRSDELFARYDIQNGDHLLML